MDADRAKKLYMDAIENVIPEFESEEERKYYAAIRKEMDEVEKKAEREGKKVVWEIPFD